MLRATWRGLETWHGRDTSANWRASPRPYREAQSRSLPGRLYRLSLTVPASKALRPLPSAPAAHGAVELTPKTVQDATGALAEPYRAVDTVEMLEPVKAMPASSTSAPTGYL